MVLSPKVCAGFARPSQHGLTTWPVNTNTSPAPCYRLRKGFCATPHTPKTREGHFAITWPVLGAKRIGRLRHSYAALNDGGWLGAVRRHKGT